MASFFQPGLQDPAGDGCESSPKFQVFCNSVLPSALSAVGIPNTNNSERDHVLSTKNRARFTQQGVKAHSTEATLLKRPLTKRPSTPSFRSTRSFYVCSESEGSKAEESSRSYDLVIVPLTVGDGPVGVHADSYSLNSSRTALNEIPAKMTLAHIRMEDFRLGDSHLVEAAHSLALTQTLNDWAGFALECTTAERVEETNYLLACLASLEVPVILRCQHDCEAIDVVDLSLAAGVIVENACILPNGERRDYFKARRLRDTMARCREQRDKRPEFFIGFLDRWETRPKPSVVRRAAKVAQHFDAVMEHGPIDSNMGGKASILQSANKSISAFEYLRRSEMIEVRYIWDDLTYALLTFPKLQKCLISGERRICVSGETNSANMKALPIVVLGSILPEASDLLKHFDTCSSMLPSFNMNEDVSPNRLLDMLQRVPGRTNFWDFGNGNVPMSCLGCFPLTSEPTKEHFDAVVRTQDHLRELGMLHKLEGLDEQQLLESLRCLTGGAENKVGLKSIIEELIDGLVCRKIRVYKGLKTGFQVPRADVNFWGVSKDRQTASDCVTDIYASLSSPCDAAVVLHTWLAHKGISRKWRFELELQLEHARSDQNNLRVPTTIRESIQGATYAELLSLTQRLRDVQAGNPILDATMQLCRIVLIDQTTSVAWRRTCALAALDDSWSMEQLLEQRLEYLRSQGANRLPNLQNLCQLYILTKNLADEAFYHGDKSVLRQLIQTLQSCFSTSKTQEEDFCVDINADIFSLIVFTVLRRAAFEDVYLETTDRCPLFLSQPDQAAVFSELWVLGSQCEIYFDLFPRDIGKVIYNRYRVFLESNPPPADYRKGNEIMTMYPASDEAPSDSKDTVHEADPVKLTPHETLLLWKKRFAAAGAMSIFCLPAIVDVTMLTFIGRGCFMTAFMEPDHLEVAGYALLASMLLTAGVTGWVGSVGNYYMAHYAYDNMIYFHVQRLSGGFVLTIVVAICGLVAFSLQKSVSAGFVFAAYIVCIATYFNILGVMSTMHLHGAPLTSGRKVILQTLPILLISPLISAFVNGHDLQIYLPVMYAFLVIILVRYRRLCHEWSGWMENIPKFTNKDILEWHTMRRDTEKPKQDSDEASVDAADGEVARLTFTAAVIANIRRTHEANLSYSISDSLVRRVSAGMPYIDWLLKKTSSGKTSPPMFTTAWFTQLAESTNQQQQLRRGLKEHNSFILFRLARHDIGQNLALFLIALMDRWIMMAMSARQPYPSIYTDSRSRYGIWLAIVYFCLSAMILDATLQKYWGHRYEVSHEKMSGLDDVDRIESQAESRRRECILKAATDVFSKLMICFGCTTIFLWLLVESTETLVIYFMYVLGYSGAIVFQFNRCFTTNISAHVTVMITSAAVSFVIGCLLHAVPATSGLLYTDVLSQNLAALLAAVGTSYFAWKDETKVRVIAATSDDHDAQRIVIQRKISSEVVEDPRAATDIVRSIYASHRFRHDDGSSASNRIAELLHLSSQKPSPWCQAATWPNDLLRKAQDMWRTQQVTIMLSTSESFHDNGLGHASSVSYTTCGVLHIVIGHLGETECTLPAWQPIIPIIACEALVHHVGRSELQLSYAQAVQAEHFIHGPDSICKRVELELASQDYNSLVRLVMETETRMMNLFCLGIDVNSNWGSTPQSVREMIVDRVCGYGTPMSDQANQWVTEHGVDLQNVNFHLKLTLNIHEQCQELLDRTTIIPVGISTKNRPKFAELHVKALPSPLERNLALSIIYRLVRTVYSTVKWVAIISGGGSNVERELSYVLSTLPLKRLILWLILMMWKACRVMTNLWIYWIIIHNKPALVNVARLAKKGERRKIKLNRGAIVVDQPREPVTGFVSHGDDNYMTLTFHKGLLGEVPQGQSPAFFSTYDQYSRLQTRVEQGHSRTATYIYAEDTTSRKPLGVEITRNSVRSSGNYDQYGRIATGTIVDGSEEINFQYHYRDRPNGNADVLRADYTLVGSQNGNSLSVFWGKPADPECYDWVPSEFIHRITQRIDGRLFITEYDYQHRRDPTVVSYVQGDDGIKTAITKRPQLFESEDELLKRPKNLSFDSEDVLYHYSITQLEQMRRNASNSPTLTTYMNPFFWLAQRNRRLYKRVPTWRVRTELWNHWMKNSSLDASTACWVDEVILREEPSLQKYWQARDSGRLDEARQALDENIDQIVSAIGMQTDVAETSLLAIKTADLYAMGLGSDANPITTQPQNCYSDTEDRISVIFNDIGCWPISPGGVSNCRRDLVNGHNTIRNHVLAECANEFGIPRFQVERNVQSMKLLPLWGLDGNTANHGIIDNLLQSQVDDKIAATNLQTDVVDTFVPLLAEFVRGARTKRYSRADLVRYSNVILAMGKFFEDKDYGTTWKSSQVQRAWMRAWLIPYNDPNIASFSECFEMEQPSVSDFRDALGIFMAYLFIYAVQVPEGCPRVFQSTHHGISSLYGMILQCKQDVTFGIWDHAIYWRETCLNISPAQCELPLSVQSMLLAGISMASRLAYFHADVIMPCASVFNPMWEIEMGTDSGTVGSRNMFNRKVDPIVNGISNIDRFKPAEKVRTEKPTVVMLSNVQFIKGVKVAIQAADVIVNQLGFKDYQLVVYGAKDRQPSYAIEMEKLIADSGLSDKVILAGFGDPKVVLQDAWLFMNSSMSEGLPLAIGEAALAGVPIVATEVGATALVLTDPKNPEQQYGEVVPPNDPVALARAQLSMLSMVGPWFKFTDDDQGNPVVLPDEILPEHVDWLTRRFYEKANDRRKLGLLSRGVVLQSFHGSRYLREHEQMYWIQWYMSKMRKENELDSLSFKFGAPRPLYFADSGSKENDIGIAIS
ncbi:glycosyl transferase [Fusarium heterosporum]|uniref:Glycosyl transferase n=1 Tax=Fusarium heterosporum TaxID=42747 RepID=A0A8H5T8C4_FUSHE|nr:glycosyl transferase [Fusarium heterosporum]